MENALRFETLAEALVVSYDRQGLDADDPRFVRAKRMEKAAAALVDRLLVK